MIVMKKWIKLGDGPLSVEVTAGMIKCEQADKKPQGDAGSALGAVGTFGGMNWQTYELAKPVWGVAVSEVAAVTVRS